MKIILSIISACLFSSLALNLYAAPRKQTIILLRHAEKDISATASRNNPDLTDAGRARALKLVDTLKKYQPEEIFSTFYIRTRMTVTPLAIDTYEKYRLQIQIYDFSELEEFSKKLLESDSRCIVVVGHNSTTPELANILIREQKYKPLGDNEYNKIFILELKKYKRKPYRVKDQMIEY